MQLNEFLYVCDGKKKQQQLPRILSGHNQIYEVKVQAKQYANLSTKTRTRHNAS